MAVYAGVIMIFDTDADRLSYDTSGITQPTFGIVSNTLAQWLYNPALAMWTSYSVPASGLIQQQNIQQSDPTDLERRFRILLKAFVLTGFPVPTGLENDFVVSFNQ